MNTKLEIISASPGLCIQDEGRPGFARYGLSAGGAMDRFALAEGRVLLTGSPGLGHATTSLEMAGFGGKYKLHGQPVRIAFSGGEMPVTVDGSLIPWRSSLLLMPGQVLDIGASQNGTYGYLSIAATLDIEPEIGSRSNHLRAGVGGLAGRALQAGDCLTLLDCDSAENQNSRLPSPDYLHQRQIRIVWGPHAKRFKPETRQRLLAETFYLSHRRDRMAMRIQLQPDQPPFEALLTGLSDPVMDGDIQMTGDGVPAILVREHQPTGGYPRIASVITADLGTVAQLPSGQPFQFKLVDQSDAVSALQHYRDSIGMLAAQLQPVILSTDQLDNLLQFNLIDGVVSASDEN